jgi:DNA repair exonuclease SbcCD nuclease subunit
VHRLAVIGDIHISARSKRTEHVLEVLDWVIDDGQKRGVTGWIFAGDLCEGSPTGTEEEMFTSRMSQMLKTGLVGIALGNHEAADAMAWLKHFPGVTFASDCMAMMPYKDVAVQLIPYPRRGHPPFDDLQDDGTIQGSLAAGRQRLLDLVTQGAVLAEGLPRIIVGHFTIEGMYTRDTSFELHTAREVIAPLTAFARDTTVVGVGGLIRHDFAEAEDYKSYTVVSIEDGAPAELLAVLVGHVHKAQMVQPGARTTMLETVPVPAKEMLVVSVTRPEEIHQYVAQAEGREVKITVEMRDDERAVWTPDVYAPLEAVAASIDVDPKVISTQRVRAPEMAKADRLRDQVQAWLNATDMDVSEEQRARIFLKSDEVEAQTLVTQ